MVIAVGLYHARPVCDYFYYLVHDRDDDQLFHSVEMTISFYSLYC